MTVHIRTSGVLGTERLLEDHRKFCSNPINFRDFINQNFYNPIQFKNSQPGLVLVNPEYEIDDLRGKSLFDSEVFLSDFTICKNILSYIGEIKDSERSFYFLGKEFGLGLVPMIVRHREQMRREAEIMALLSEHAQSYYIAFAGPTYVRVFDHALDKSLESIASLVI
jgi:hypothetical protein